MLAARSPKSFLEPSDLGFSNSINFKNSYFSAEFDDLPGASILYKLA